MKKILDMKFIDSDVRTIFEAFDFVADMVDKKYSVESIVTRTLEKFGVDVFTKENLDAVREAAEILCDDAQDSRTILDFCMYSEIAMAGYKFGA